MLQINAPGLMSKINVSFEGIKANHKLLSQRDSYNTHAAVLLNSAAVSE